MSLSNPVANARRIVVPLDVEKAIRMYLDGMKPEEIAQVLLLSGNDARVIKALRAAFCCDRLRGTIYYKQHLAARKELRATGQMEKASRLAGRQRA